MNKEKVQSSMIDSIAYDSDKQVLQIWFNTGASYQYYNVPEQVYTELRNADSVGSYFTSNIKYKYKYERQ